jgi:excinuclease ABC subunit A
VPSFITVTGAAEQNLKNIDLSIPRHAITVITGVSGSGKSTLAFDTILNEAQRRFFYTLSHYSRQFLELGTRAKVTRIGGLSPAIALAQNETQASPRASVGSQSDLNELLGVIYARFGERRCPKHNLPTGALPREELLPHLAGSLRNGQLLAICAPIAEQKKGHFEQQLSSLVHKGFLKAYIDGKLRSLTPIPKLNKEFKHTIKLVVDQLSYKASSSGRLERSITTALSMGGNIVEIIPLDSSGEFLLDATIRVSLKDGCPVCAYSWPALDPRYFSPNSLGRCEDCKGLGVRGVEDEGENDADDDEKEVEREENPAGQWAPHALCQACKGTGISANYASILVAGQSIIACHQLPLNKLREFLLAIDDARLSRNQAFLRVRDEAVAIIARILAIGLGYLHLGRRIKSLSTGESQRLRLANLLAEQLRGITYVLDEPSQGLHPSELERLQEQLTTLRDLGNSIIIVDHDETVIKGADHIIDLGPAGGSKGGYVLAEFSPKDAAKFSTRSATAAYLCRGAGSQAQKAAKKSSRAEEKDSSEFLRVHKATLHNLAIDEVSFKVGALNVVTGVSGAGKSNLLLRSVYPLAANYYAQGGGKTSAARANKPATLAGLPCAGISGLTFCSGVSLIDRRPLAKSSVSMPATYLDIFSYIRSLYSQVADAQILGLSPRMFSLSVQGGRCPECGGRGELLMSMRFLADARVRCPLCQGARYQDHLLEIRYQGVNISELLQFTIDEALDFFKNHRLVVQRLKPAQDLGLGYLKLGQPSRTLSGGEAQRLKLAPLLGKNSKINQQHLLIMEEPTQGLHPQDIDCLLVALKKITDLGCTILMVEHCFQVIAAADWVVDIGPAAAAEGGKLLYEGVPHGLLKAKASLTGQYFGKWLREG